MLGDVHHIDIKPRVELIGKRAAVPIVFILGKQKMSAFIFTS